MTNKNGDELSLPQTDYEAAYAMLKEAYDRLENRDNPGDTKLLGFASYFTSAGVRFPDKEAEAEFRKFVSYPKGSSETRIAASYFITLVNALERTAPRQRSEEESKLERGLAG